MKKGEALVIEMDEQKIAAYKDDERLIRAPSWPTLKTKKIF